MEVKGDQHGNIQNSDLIINHSGMSAVLSGPGQEALRALGELQARVRAVALAGGVDEKTAQAASQELAITSRELAAGGGAAAISGLERTRRILGTAAGATSLVTAISNIISVLHGSGGN